MAVPFFTPATVGGDPDTGGTAVAMQFAVTVAFFDLVAIGAGDPCDVQATHAPGQLGRLWGREGFW